MKTRSFFLASTLAVAMLVAVSASAAAETTCRMNFELKGWSVGLKVAHGEGTVTCENGQQAEVRISAKGAGLSAGKYELREGHGRFTGVSDISELFGSYAAVNAGAGAVKDAEALAMTKGPVSLALDGKGTGWELGVTVDRFTISARK